MIKELICNKKAMNDYLKTTNNIELGENFSAKVYAGKVDLIIDSDLKELKNKSKPI
jgi:hypothetical protein